MSLPSFNNQSDAQNFLYYLNRESTNDDCHFPVTTKLAEIKKILAKCPDAEKYFEAFREHKKKGSHTATPKLCDDAALAKTVAFIEIFGAKTGRLYGAKNFCAAASHYFKNRDFGYDACVDRFKGKRDVDVKDVLKAFSEVDKKTLCGNIGLAEERALALHDEIRQIEGAKSANHSKRADWLRQIGAIDKEGEPIGERKFSSSKGSKESKKSLDASSLVSFLSSYSSGSGSSSSSSSSGSSRSSETFVSPELFSPKISTSPVATSSSPLVAALKNFKMDPSMDNWLVIANLDENKARLLFDRVQF